MSKKTVSLITLAILLGALSLYFNLSRFKAEPLKISHRSVAPRGATARGRGAKEAANPVIFLLNHETRLTSVKVIPAEQLATNKYALPIWELSSTSNSVPLKDFVYGNNIRGMKPAVKGATPEPLQPGVAYRVMIEAGSSKAEHEFTPVPRAP